MLLYASRAAHRRNFDKREQDLILLPDSAQILVVTNAAFTGGSQVMRICPGLPDVPLPCAIFAEDRRKKPGSPSSVRLPAPAERVRYVVFTGSMTLKFELVDLPGLHSARRSINATKGFCV
ncbi:hypothetical protein JQ543_10355 [Bradyrhizobium diazoefficiens]|nr:hypothetical protein [Bradyrhizobium diazoefficiens]MBR0848141.1 hypothetical protein [Bradyrhizobium diazoefficiens]